VRAGNADTNADCDSDCNTDGDTHSYTYCNSNCDPNGHAYKARNRMRNFKDVPDEAIRSINAPTLVVSLLSRFSRSEKNLVERVVLNALGRTNLVPNF
jgi:hypothetical protein